jgi:hypothetical protein
MSQSAARTFPNSERCNFICPTAILLTFPGSNKCMQTIKRTNKSAGPKLRAPLSAFRPPHVLNLRTS